MIRRAIAERGSSDACVHCGLPQANQHTLRQSAACDGIKNGKIKGERASRVRAAHSKGLTARQ